MNRCLPGRMVDFLMYSNEIIRVLEAALTLNLMALPLSAPKVWYLNATEYKRQCVDLRNDGFVCFEFWQWLKVNSLCLNGANMVKLRDMSYLLTSAAVHCHWLGFTFHIILRLALSRTLNTLQFYFRPDNDGLFRQLIQFAWNRGEKNQQFNPSDNHSFLTVLCVDDFVSTYCTYSRRSSPSITGRFPN